MCQRRVSQRDEGQRLAALSNDAPEYDSRSRQRGTRPTPRCETLGNPSVRPTLLTLAMLKLLLHEPSREDEPAGIGFVQRGDNVFDFVRASVQ